MRSIQPFPHRVEVQAIRDGDSVLLHCAEDRKILIEIDSAGLCISVAFGDETVQNIPVFDGYGEEIAVLTPPVRADG